MILSHRHRFVFVKGTKVGGTSVEIALSGLCGPDDIVTPVIPIDDKPRIESGHPPRNYARDRATEADYVRRVLAAAPERLHATELPPPSLLFYNHMPLAEIERKAGVPLDCYAIVCAERSPYAKAISLAHWSMQGPAYGRGRPMRFDPAETRRALDIIIANGTILRCRNIDRYRRANGELDASVLRFDALADDFAAWLTRLRIPPPHPVLPHAKAGNYSVRPVDLLSTDQIAAINALFREEFAAFGHPML
ncbi:MAG: hypothetical protein ABI886_18385 [Betaproteobacteria bacterium]